MANQPGLAWKQDRWGNTEPIWTPKPSLEIMKRICEGLLRRPLEVEFLAEGGKSRPELAFG